MKEKEKILIRVVCPKMQRGTTVWETEGKGRLGFFIFYFFPSFGQLLLSVYLLLYM